MRLADLGWDDDVARAYERWSDARDMQPGRVAVEFNYLYRVLLESEEIEAVLAGRVKHHATSRSELPAVGDWVVVRKRAGEHRGTIVAVLPRRSRFSRRLAGQITDEQVVAANVDTIFIVMALDHDFSLRRLERYLLLARESGADPVVLLTKPDLADEPAALAADVARVAADAPVHVLNPKSSEGVEQVTSYVTKGRTAALLGSSGVGKSTIINRLVGADVRKTRDVRESDSKGRHTTTHRELVILPGGGLIIDTPGMRELQLWDVTEAVRETFEDVESLSAGCYFADCRHRGEPRCAVKEAVAAGELGADRLASYLKLQDEIAELARQQDERAQIEERRRSRASRPPGSRRGRL
jgi:ribosome biogenesis GTPase